MDAENGAAMALLQAVEQARSELCDYNSQMRNRHQARFTSSRTRAEVWEPCTMGEQQNDGSISIFTTLSPIGWRAVCWTIDVRWSAGGWLVEAEVWADSEENPGQDLLIEFPQRRAQSVAACIEHLRAATRDIVSSGDVHEILDKHSEKQ